MKNAILLSTIILYINSAVFSQDIDIKWGKIETFSKNAPTPKLLALKSQDIVLLKGTNTEKVKDFFIEIHDKSSLLSKKKINFNTTTLPQISEDYLHSLYFSQKNDNYLLFSYVLKGNIYLFRVTSFDSKWEIQKEGSELFRFSGDENNKFDGEYEIMFDDDKFSVFLVMPSAKREFEKYKYTVYNNLDFSVIGTNEVVLPYENRDFNINNYFLDTKNNLYITGVYKNRKLKTKNELLLFFDFKNQESTEINVPKPGKNVTQYIMDIDENNNIDYYGLLTNKTFEPLFGENQSMDAQGLFYIKFEPQTGKIITKSRAAISTFGMHPDSKELFTELGLMSSDYILKQVYHPHPDTVIFITEYSTDALKSSGSMYSNSSYTVNIRRHNIIFKADNSGKIISTTIVPKNQKLKLLEQTNYMFVPIKNVKRNDRLREMLSFFSTYSNGNLYLFYNDNKENMKIENLHDPKVTKFTEETAFTLAKIGKDGKLTRQLIFDKSDNSFLVCPQNTQLISENEILFFSISKMDNACKIGIMNFESK